MKTLTKIFALIAIACMSSASLFAQKEQVAFVSGTFEIDAQTRESGQILDRFKEDFKNARLLRLEDGSYQIEITFEKRGTSWTDIYPLSREELSEIRNVLLEKKESYETKPSSRSGRAYLITSTSFNSISQGILTSFAFSRSYTYTDPFGSPSFTYRDRTQFGYAFPFISIAGHIAGSAILTSKKDISLAAANAHFWGAGTGTLHGLSLYELFSNKNSEYGVSISMGLSSIAESWIMYEVAKRNKWDYTSSVVYNTGNIWGYLIGSSLSLSIFDSDQRINAAMGLVGSTAGLLAYPQLQKAFPRTTGDYRAINTLGVIGMGWSLSYLDYSQSVRRFALASFLASSASLAAGHLLTSDANFSSKEGGLIALGSLAGGVMGLGLAVGFEASSSSSFFSYVAGAATISWVASYLYLKNQNQKGANTLGFLKGKEAEKLNFQFNPAAVALAQGSEHQQRAMLQMNGDMSWVKLGYAIK